MVVITAIEDDRLDIQKMAALITTGIIKPTRWSLALKQVAVMSKRHAKAVKELIEQLLTFNPEDSPQNTAFLLELLYELCLELNQSITYHHAIEFCKTNNKGGKQKTYAKSCWR